MRNVVSFFLLAFLLFPIPTFAGMQDDLLDAVENTFSKDFTTFSNISAKVAVDEKDIANLSFSETVNKKGDNWEAHSDGEISFDTSLLPAVMGPFLPNMSGAVSIGSDFYYQEEDTNIWFRLRSIGIDIDTTNFLAAYADMFEGIFEITKFVQNDYIVMDLEEVISIFSEISQIEREAAPIKEAFESTLYSIRNTEEYASEIFKTLLATGIFDIEKSRGAYILTLQDNIEGIQPEGFAELAELLYFSEEEITDMVQELQYIKDNSEIFQPIWTEITQKINVEIRVNVSRGRVVFISAKFHSHEDVLLNSDQKLPIDISFSVTVSIKNEAERISFPKEEEINTVDFTKFFKGIYSLLLLEM
jgi:hypothetical protein